MRFYTKKRRVPSIIIVSLIDILAILLIFFIVTTTFRPNQPQLLINLPESKTAEQAAAAKSEPLVLRIKSSEEMTLDNKPVTLDRLSETLRSLRAQNPARPVAMQADREAPFGLVVGALDAMKEAGLRNVPAFTQPKSAN